MQKTEIVGLAPLQRELRKVDAALPKQLRGVNLEAAELVAGKARAAAESQGGVAAHVAPSIRAAAEQQRAKIVLDANKEPAILGAEFGSLQFDQFGPWTGNRWTDPEGLGIGYFVHPTVRDVTRDGELVELYDDRLARLIARAFPD